MSARPLSPETIGSIADRVVARLRDELSQISVPAPAAQTPESLLRAANSLRQAHGQTEALRALLSGAAVLGGRAALFVVKQGLVECWEGTGFDADFGGTSLRGTRLDNTHGAAATALQDGRTIHLDAHGDTAIPSFGQTMRSEALLIPLRVQEKIAALLYVDPAEAKTTLDRTGLELLTEICGVVIERQVLARYAAVREDAPSRPVAPPATPAPTSAPTPATAAEPPAAKPIAMPAQAPAASSVPAPSIPPRAAAERIAERTPTGPIVASAPAISPAMASIMGQGSDDPEVEDARRFARLLMEEIYLYHSDQVEQGRAAKDLRARLGDEIDRARIYYEERVKDPVRQRGDYFQEAIVRVLAGGDARALGEPANQTT